MPVISVIVPVYRVEAYLNRCIQSILNQTYKDFELILIDDGSPDNCPTMCDEYAKQDSRIHVIHQENGGLSSARNAGIDWVFENSDSEWITFIDSDDWVHSEYIDYLLTAAIDNNVIVSSCSFLRVDEENSVSAPNILDSVIIDPETFFVKNNTNATIACGKLYNKICFNDIRFPVGKIHEDEFTTYKILFSCKKVAFTIAPLYYYFTNPDGIMSTVTLQSCLDRSDALFQQYKDLSKVLSKVSTEQLAKSYLNRTFELLYNFKNNTNYNKEFSAHRRNLRKLLKKHKFAFKTNIHLYEQAYPRIILIYWYYKAILKKFKK